jgi:hypothetical protein
MRGGAIFLAFFGLFTVASYAVPVPLFPGNLILLLGFVTVPTEFASSISAIVNGVTYGLVVWLVFVLVSRRFEEPKVTAIKRNVQQNKKRT